MSIKISCPIVAQTPSDASYFFGFHDLSPWSADDELVVLHRFEGDLDALPSGRETAAIVVWDRRAGSFRTVGETATWNLQQGARACWVPGRARTIAYNRLVDGAMGSEFVDISTGARRTYPFAIGAIAPDGGSALSPHFGRLGRYWKAYGYQNVPPPPGLENPAPQDDGIWRLDLQSGKVELIIPIAALSEMDRNASGTRPYRFVTHIAFNPSGTRFVFYDRYISKDGALFSRLLSAKPDGSDLKVLATEKVSHFAWLDDDTLMVWMRKSMLPIASFRRAGILAMPLMKPLVDLARFARGRVKGALLQESYYELNALGAKPPQPLAAALFSEDGHPMVSPDGNWIVLDTYPDRSGMIPVMLYNRRRNARIDIGAFHHGVTSRNGDLKCDFHPRWNRAGTQVAGDICTGGRRAMVILDVTPVVGDQPGRASP